MATGGSSIYKGSDLIHDYSCSKCEEDDLNTEAQHFCPQCEHYLCDKCVNMHRSYFKKHTVYGRGDIQKWAGFSMDRCDQHGNKLEVHCDDHQELCCHVCVALNHRLCCSISHLPDLARGYLETKEFKQLPVAVEKMKRRIDELKKTSLKDLASLKDSHKSIIVEIKALRTEVNKIFDKLEKKTVDQLDRMINDLEKGLKNDLDSCANMHDQLKTMMEKLQQITNKHKNIGLFIGYKKCKVKLGEANVIVQDIQKRPKQVLRFKSDESLLKVFKNISSLGCIETVSSLPKRTDRDHVYTTQSSGEYNVRIKKDQNDCNITGICELPNGDFVISDSNNKRVKLLNKKYQVIDHFDLSSYPCHLCHISGNEVAVALEEYNARHEVHFLMMSRGKLHAGRRLTTDHQCNSVGHHQGQLYISSNDALHQYTISGILVKKIYGHKSEYWKTYKIALSPDGERIYISNYADSKLITLDKSGQVLSTLNYYGLQETTGLCVSPSGHVFVCGARSQNVLQVDREGRRKLSTVATKSDGISNPRSVCFSEQNSSLIVGNYANNNIIVVKLC